MQNGYCLRFTSPPTSIPPKLSTFHLDLLRTEVNILLQKKAVEAIPYSQQGTGIYFRYFLVLKKDKQEFRAILDLKVANKWIRKEKFRMPALHQIYPQLHQGDWLCSIDLHDAYFHIPITRKHSIFLRFAIGYDHY